MTRLIPIDYDLLVNLWEYLDDRADVRDGDYGVPLPNREMQLAESLRELLDADERAVKHNDGWWELAKSLMRGR